MCCASRVKLITFEDSPYDVLEKDGLILVDASDGAVVVNLPDAETNKGHSWQVKKVDDSANTVTVDCDDATQEADDETDGFVLSEQYQAVVVKSDGADYQIVSDYNPGQNAFHRVTISGINGKTVTTGTIITADQDYDFAFARVICTNASGITTAPTMGIGIAAGESDVAQHTYLEGLVEADRSFRLDADLLHRIIPEGAVLKWGLPVAAIGTSQTLKLVVFLIKI